MEAPVSSGSVLQQFFASYGNLVPFEAWMEQALYHPHLGYYIHGISDIGPKGDFSTSATLGPLLGEAIAAWLMESKQQLFPRGEWHIIELGGGNGRMAESVLKNLSWWQRRKLHYHIVEISPVLQAMQKERLRKWQRVIWHSSIRDALLAAKNEAFIFSNEFVDAFPCEIFQKTEAGWEKLFLQLDIKNQILETWQPAPNLPVSSIFEIDSVQKKGQRVETHVSYGSWLQEWSPLWKKGSMLTIDYGANAEMLYYRKPYGSLRAYFQHIRLEGPELYHRFGKQDITADVNFTDLQHFGEKSGWKQKFFISQGDFVKQYASPEPSILADSMTAEDGMGTAFQVLCMDHK